MIFINSKSNSQLYQQIYEQIKNKIVIGEYPEGYRLTSTRELSKELCVGRNTVESAYNQLCLEGYIESRERSGYVVQNMSEDSLVSGNIAQHEILFDHPDIPPRKIADIVNHGTRQQYKYDFQYGNLDTTLFPYSQWRRLSAEVLSSREAGNISYYTDNQGELTLRAEIQKYLHESRGVLCNPEQIILCCGTRYALELICKMFSKSKRVVAFEEPGFDGSRIVFENNSYKINPVPINKSGIDLDIIEKSSAQIAYITPSHQFPSGVVMPIHHRINLLNWAKRTNAVIIEDDYDSEFRYHSRPIPSLQSIDRHGRVIYLGTFSKSFAPGLRMAYMILPKGMLPLYQKMYNRYPSTVPWLQQRVMTLYMERGYWQRHLRKVCLKNKKKYDLLLHTINKEFGSEVRVHGHDAGLHILLELQNGEHYDLLANKAKQHGVKVYTTLPHWHQKECCPDNVVLLGFSNLSETEIEEGISLLKSAWF